MMETQKTVSNTIFNLHRCHWNMEVDNVIKMIFITYSKLPPMLLHIAVMLSGKHGLELHSFMSLQPVETASYPSAH